MKQSRKVGVAGGFINQMMGNNSTVPVVGEGATILHYSDRSAYEVISVSNDSRKCTIRKMATKFIGEGYGDERYEYSSDLEGSTVDLEWNEKKGSWGKVYFTTEIIKSLFKKLDAEYGYKLWDNLPNGLSSDDLYEKRYDDDYYNKMKLIPNVTKEYKNFEKVSVIFGVCEEYCDPSF
jgi:hypothetical protein